MRELLAKLPTPDKLLACTPTQLDGILTAAISERIKRSQQDQTAPRNIELTALQGMYPIGEGVTFAQRQRVDIAITESWQRLMNRGFLMQAIGQSAGVMTLTSKGLEAADPVKFEEIIVRQSLTRDMLHSELRGSVYDSFTAGHYDTAVRDAFALVEDAVRTKAGPAAAPLVGAKLMRKAFKAPMADFFAGAFGVFRNLYAHRNVGNADPAPVIEELMIASRLLRFVKP